jgi:hypothetical protein
MSTFLAEVIGALISLTCRVLVVAAAVKVLFFS